MRGGHTKLNYYRLSANEVLEELGTNPGGLTSIEAKKRLAQYGPNTLERVKHESAWITFLRQFKNILVIMLLISTGFAIYLDDLKTASILVIIAAMNASIGYFQEHKAETLMKSLEKLLVPKAKVKRSHRVMAVDSSELVIGDVVYIESGDSVPADIRIIEEAELGTNDFALTGEANPSRKFVHAIGAEVPLGSRDNQAYMGTTVATGTAYGVVIGTGMHTELGRLAALSQATRSEQSPLQKEMNHLSTRVAQVTIVLTLLLIFIATKEDLGLQYAILFGISIGAAMIPNGLVTEVNITLSQTANRLAKAKALVKRLSAVETLGATNVILTDKTGTLTKNEMTIEQLLIGRDQYKVTGTGYEGRGDIVTPRGKAVSEATLKDLELFFMTAGLASNAKVDPPDGEHDDWYVVGDPTEGALITLTRKAGITIETIDEEIPELKEFQFDSARKLLSSVRKRGNLTVVFTKGAPEAVLERSTEVWDHGHIRKITDKDREFFKTYHEKQAKAAKRNLALAYRVLPKSAIRKKFVMDEVEQDFIFLGMVSMSDPLREAVPEAIQAAHAAHVKVAIITGDYPTTARAIARKAGLGENINIILGEELPMLTDSRILQQIQHGNAVFSRVSPEDKLRIVDIVKRSGKVVAVTGDGINDAPALKSADIGVAMGQTGTDVAKNAAEIVLLDDSFTTLVGAMEEGRLTFHNIRKAARCALTANAGELLIILISLFGTIVFHIPAATTAIQILAIDIIAQLLPVTALGWDRAGKGIMKDPPRKLHDHIINRDSIIEFIQYGALTALLGYANYLFFFERNSVDPAFIDTGSNIYAQATILTYLTIVLCQFVNILFVRADEHKEFFTDYLWSNKVLLGAFAISIFLVLNVMYNPLVQPFFGAGPLGFIDWLTAIACALIYAAFRLFQRHNRHHSRHNVIQLHRKVHGAKA